MATVINNPQPVEPVQSTDRPGNSGLVLGLIALVLVILFLVFGLPGIRRSGTNNSTGSGTEYQVNVPDKVDVNVNKNP